MNYAENALAGNPDLNATALIGIREGGNLDTPERVTWGQLRERVREAASALRRCGIRREMVVAAMVGNSVWAVVLFLASASLGAVFTSINPDLGAEVSARTGFSSVGSW